MRPDRAKAKKREAIFGARIECAIYGRDQSRGGTGALRPLHVTAVGFRVPESYVIKASPLVSVLHSAAGHVTRSNLY